MIGRHLCVVPYVSFTQRNIFFQLFRRSLIYIRLRLNNSKNTFGQVKELRLDNKAPLFSNKAGLFPNKGWLLEKKWQLFKIKCHLLQIKSLLF